MHAFFLTRSRRNHWGANIARGAGIFLALALLSSACSDDSASPEAGSECSIENPCPETKSCLQGVCVGRVLSQCNNDDDCPGGDYRCIDAVCKLPTPDAGPSANNGADASHNNNPNPPDTTAGEGPRVVSISPADGAEDVALDTAITIQFSEAMDPTSMNFYSLVVRDANNLSLDLDAVDAIVYDAETYTTTLTPAGALKPSEGYKVEVRSGARNMRGVGINPPVSATFITRYEEPARHRDLARTWAPILYQGIDPAEGVTPNENATNIVNPTRPDADIPTRIDFDGNRTASDNLRNAQDASEPMNASIYYSVSESDKYYFLHYILYYPTRYGVDTHAEHDFAGLVVVVDKASQTMMMSESVSLVGAGEVTLGFKPEGSPVGVPGGDLGERNMRAFPPGELEDGTHFPLYVLAGSHQACHWYKTGRDGHCLHARAQFPGPATGAQPGAAAPTSGVLMRPADAGQTFEQATLSAESGFWEMTYALVPIPTGLWALRGNYDANGLFDLAFPYKPAGTDRPTGVGPDENLMLPKILQSNAPSTNGRMPFSWMATPGQRNQGQWLLDPVYIMENRYLFGGNTSTDYCYNFYLNIDNRGGAAYPGCAQ